MDRFRIESVAIADMPGETKAPYHILLRFLNSKVAPDEKVISVIPANTGFYHVLIEKGN